MRERSNFQQRTRTYIWYGSGIYRPFSDSILRPLIKSPTRSSALLIIILFLFVCSFLTSRLLYSTPMAESSTAEAVLTSTLIHSHTQPHNTTKIPKKPYTKIEFPLNCSSGNLTRSCPTNHATRLEFDVNASPLPACPDYFRWIYEDLQPWRDSGITREMVEKAKRTANFRLVIVNGRAYIDRYQKAFQTRDVFTLWGIVQLLRKYPGKVPDLELMFDCVDWPVVMSSYFRGPNATAPPPLFRYCGDDKTLDIVFPDWSFWGWPEINIKPWESLLKELKEGNEKRRWMEREPYAYWKGNPVVAETRMDLLKCNVSDRQDWHARVYAQDWIQESKHGYAKSELASQCIHRYKIYIEGSAWSVSLKYILACDSVTLLVKPQYYDFFSRILMPVHHYWPIRDDDKCKSLKFAVEWGNSHKQKAQEIGKAASDFILKDLKMDFVYDYMLHLLTEYAKLLKFRPSIPQNAIELCSETLACPSIGLEKKFMMDSMVHGPSETSPCAMPAPYDKVTLQALLRRRANSIRQVAKWEKDYWDNQAKHL
ncbi:hypothetical protein Nepgr_010832 [Nepenthes gracilis]|uniref:Glycosyl transferase CAP10 domain-containing protein n=1 Tax=Nepenthes gracilis TaxID=150966 RepID=A0AAD3SDB8_NEPGR|nr:hypothetical protein Nepgr_010832 [Nepenthes gracilis]